MKSSLRTSVAASSSLLIVTMASLLGASCAKSTLPAVGVSHLKPEGSGSASAAPIATVPVLGSTQIASLHDGSGPYLAHNGDRGLAVWAAPDAKGGMFWFASPIDASGKPISPGKTVATAPPINGLMLTSLRPLGADGFVLVWARRVDQGQVVESLAMNTDGTLRGMGASLLSQSTEPVLWADAVQTQQGAHVYVVHERPNHEGKVSVISLDAQGKPASAPRPVYGSASAWQPTSAGAGSLLLAVRAEGGTTGLPRGTVIAIPVDASGNAASEPVMVSAAGAADLDVDAVSIGSSVYVGWTDRRESDGQVTVAMVDALGKVTQPARAMVSSAGDQALIGLTTTSGEAPSLLVAWDDIAARDRQSRLVQLTSFDAKLALQGGPVTLPFASRDGVLPTLIGAPDGFVALTLAQSCLSAGLACTTGPTPAYVWFDKQLRVKSGAPVYPDVLAGEAPSMVYAPSCSSAGCQVLAAEERESTLVYLTRLSDESTGWKPVVTSREPTDRPSLLSAGAISSGPRLADLAAAKVGERIVVAGVTEHMEGGKAPPLPPDVDAKAEAQKDRDPKNPRTAIVSVQSLDASGTGNTKPSTITLRGLSAAGVAIAPATNGKDACVAWSAKDRGIPQIFLTRVGADGKKNAQMMVTARVKGEVGDITITPAEDGWLVAWVDNRDGNAEVYAMRVDHELHRKQEQRITNAPGDASEVTLITREKDVLLAYSDARTKGDTAGDVYLSRLDRTSAAKVGDEIRLSHTTAHARSLHLTTFGADTLASWIEQGSGKGESVTTVHVAKIDATGVAKSLPAPLEGLSGASSLGVSCARDACRIVVTKASDDGAVLLGASWSGQSNVVSAHRVLPLFSGPMADVVPAVIDDLVFLADLASPPPADEGRVRRVKLMW